MKKLILIFAVLLVAIGMQAQTYTAVINTDATYIAKAIGTTGFRLTNTDTVDIVVTVNSPQPFTLDATMTVDSVSGNAYGTLYVLGKKDLEADVWNAIANTTWATNASSDKELLVSHATAVRYRYIMLRFIGAGTGLTDADAWSLKLWRE